MRRKPDLRLTCIKYHELGREQNVSEYVELLSIVRLNSSVAICEIE